MKLPNYLSQRHVDLPVDYEWSRRIANKFQAVPGEDHPKLWDALHQISIRAAFALGVACSEWVVARLRHVGDVSDALLRIEAAWAATIDWRYTNLPEPDDSETDPALEPVVEPIWLATLFLTDLHSYYVKTHQQVPNRGVRGTTLREALLARHVTPKEVGFDKWLTASLRKAQEHYPATEAPIQDETPVPPDFFDPEFAWSEEAVKASQARLLSELNPLANPYLRKPDQMRADGFEGEPYQH